MLVYGGVKKVVRLNRRCQAFLKYITAIKEIFLKNCPTFSVEEALKYWVNSIPSTVLIDHPSSLQYSHFLAAPSKKFNASNASPFLATYITHIYVKGFILGWLPFTEQKRKTLKESLLNLHRKP